MPPAKRHRTDVNSTEDVTARGGADSHGNTAQSGGANRQLRLEPGAVPVPDYQLVEFLGRGGYGEVWKAVGPGGHPAALKFISLGEAAGAVEERSTELLRSRDVRHPNLLGVLASWRRDDLLILAMPLADRPLTDRLNEACRQGLPGVPFAELLGYMREAAQGLDHLHSLGVQHRDVKPHNLLLVGGAVQVADFGLAKVLEQTSTSNTGAMTASYAAPEFLKGRVHQHSDQYSLAVAYCHLRGGRLPFVGNAAQVMMGHLSGRPDLTMLPNEAERRVVAKALEKDPRRRWPSCREFVEALAQTSAPVRHRRLPLALAGGLLLVAAAVIGVVLWLGRTPPPPAVAPTAPVADVTEPPREPPHLTPAKAPDPTPPLDKKPDAAETTAGGKTVGVDGNRLRFTADGKERTVIVPAGAAVRIDGKDGTLDEIKKDGAVTVTSRGDVVSKVEVRNPPPPPPNPAPQPPKVAVAAGKVVGVDKDRLTVHADDGDKIFTVPADARVTIDDKDGRLADVRKNSTVSVTRQGDVVVTVVANSPPPPAPAKAPFGAAEAKRVQQEWADYLGVPVEREADLGGGVTMKLRLIPPGTFRMGSPEGEDGRFDNEGPQHQVEITRPFYTGVYPVTKGQFAAFVQDDHYQTEAVTDGQGGHGYNAATRMIKARGPKYTWQNTGWDQTDAHPVVNVTWNDAQAFCAWLSHKAGKTYELPWEAEWEYACRAGTTTRFWCGDDDASLKGNANTAAASLQGKLDPDSYKPPFWSYVSWDDGYPFTSPVGMFRANPWGLYDMHGNVWQWCADRYGPYQNENIKDPKGSESGETRVLRGGSWGSSPRYCRSAYRVGNENPGNRHANRGFRVVLRLAPRTP